MSCSGRREDVDVNRIELPLPAYNAEPNCSAIYVTVTSTLNAAFAVRNWATSSSGNNSRLILASLASESKVLGFLYSLKDWHI